MAGKVDLQFVEVELTRNSGEDGSLKEIQRKKVYVTEVSGICTLDLYSGWVLEGEEHKFKLQALPIKVCSFVNIERLWLSHNNLSELPNQFTQLVNLRELFLHHNAFSNIPTQLFRLTKLEILWVSSNMIEEVQPEISQLKSLRQLHLEHNCIQIFQETLCDLPAIEVLYLNHNKLRTISKNINKLANTLRRFYVHNNKIQAIPEAFCLLLKLEILYLQENEIASVPLKFDSFCEVIKTGNNAIVQADNNPFILPRSKVKSSVTGPPPSLQILQLNPTRRYSDDHCRARSHTESDIKQVRQSHRFSVPTATIGKDDIDHTRKSSTIHR